ncbi:MAG: TldD/PmbA family protein [Spirochaetia bacterium]|nr:TldD/PmbA family protein [Spirochaetia bacterium]
MNPSPSALKSTSSASRLPFPEHLENLRALMPRLVEIMESGKPTWYAFAFLEEVVSITTTAHRTELSQTQTDRGIVLRILANGKNYEHATNELEEASLLKAAANLRSVVEKEKPVEDAPVYRPESWEKLSAQNLPEATRAQFPKSADPKEPVHFSPIVSLSPWEIPLGELMEKTRALKKRAEEKDRSFVAESGGAFTEPLPFIMATHRLRLVTHVFVDREKNMSQSLPVCMAIISGQSAKGKSGRSFVGGSGGLELLSPTDDDFVDAIEIPHRLDKAKRLAPGIYPVISGPDVTGVIAHEAFGHTQEGDTVRQGRSVSTGFAASRVGNDEATIMNDAAVFAMEEKSHGSNASYFFDHEGQFAAPQAILNKGFLSPPMTDLLSALHLGAPRTGNGKRESWRRPTLVRQTNTYFTAGTHTLEELIGMTKGTAYLAVESHGGMEDPKGANLTAGAEYFEEIIDGKRTGELVVGPQGGHIELSGYVPDMLSNILGKTKVSSEAISPVPESLSGGCGKYHKEYVQAGCGGTYILWKGLTCG